MLPLVSSRWGSASRHIRKVPVRLTRMTRSHRSVGHSWVCAVRMIPAMLASTSSRPKGSTAARTVRATAASSPTSATWVRMPPWSLAVTSRPCSSTSTARTRRALRGEPHRRRATDAGRGAGDDRDLPLEPFQRHGSETRTRSSFVLRRWPVVRSQAAAARWWCRTGGPEGSRWGSR